MPPELSAARDEEKREQTLERQRMWYVACTRARDLLVIPHLPEASLQSWSKILNLGHDSLPELDLTTLSVATAVNEAQPANTQDADLFGEESRSMAAAAQPLDWRLPSAHDRDRTELLEPMVRSIDAAFEFVSPIGGGRVRGIVLHKLMEEFLTGELDENDLPGVEARARDLLMELKAMEGAASASDPAPGEMARTAANTLKFADVAALRPHLVPEVPIWSNLGGGKLIAGRADAVAVQGDEHLAVLDWKSDLAPSRDDRSGHIAQLKDYIATIGAAKGAIVYMSLGEVVWVQPGPAASIA
jgi:ATP-dependent exoDNAse (exonuclease V) beta subunit